MSSSTQFVFHFSTAQEAIGYVTLGEHQVVESEILGGPVIPPGIYSIQGNILVRVDQEEAGDQDDDWGRAAHASLTSWAEHNPY